jgi:DNA-binding SARP family transcriptional activator
VALARDPGEAGRRAAAEAALEAAAEARTRRDRAGLAESLELRAAAAAEPGLAHGDLEEALQLWRDLHCPVAAARVEVRLDELGGVPTSDAAERVLKAAGAASHRSPDIAKIAATGGASAPASLTVRTFGGFEVIRDGRTVATAEWGSKKARDLFKILLTRRGRHVPREQLQEILWPDDDGARAGRRLSVAVSTVRAVLDPGHLHPATRFVAADRDAVWIERDHLAIDLEMFLADAADGLAKTARGSADAVAALRSAEAAHRGEFLVEDAFEDWAAGLREECRQAYIGVGHRLARLATADGDHEAAARYLRRVLERDEFDEGAHLSLVAALAAGGHPGDARRAYGAYMARMEELDVEAAPFPD